MVAEMSSPLEHRAVLLEAVAEIRSTTLVEPGCLKYDFYESPFEPGKYTFVEEWESADSLREHARTSNMARFQERIAGKVTGSKISIHEVSSTRIR